MGLSYACDTGLQWPIGPAPLDRLGKPMLIEENPKESLEPPGREAGLDTRVCRHARRILLNIKSRAAALGSCHRSMWRTIMSAVRRSETLLVKVREQ